MATCGSAGHGARAGVVGRADARVEYAGQPAQLGDQALDLDQAGHPLRAGEQVPRGRRQNLGCGGPIGVSAHGPPRPPRRWAVRCRPITFVPADSRNVTACTIKFELTGKLGRPGRIGRQSRRPTSRPRTRDRRAAAHAGRRRDHGLRRHPGGLQPGRGTDLRVPPRRGPRPAPRRPASCRPGCAGRTRPACAGTPRPATQPCSTRPSGCPPCAATVGSSRSTWW